ncbi:cold shock domain protein 1 [Prunus dulcis]|uniref:Cold shock domain protein 1 n=1 Tax=Prunus dulcis TaxID=3755 RepID=A0A4Y1R6R7_PRUDU|nr:cold shock domain protein 1 [Prunus dulcis]
MHCSVWISDLASGEALQNFGTKSRYLVSGPDIGLRSVTRRDSLRFPRNSVTGPVTNPSRSLPL